MSSRLKLSSLFEKGKNGKSGGLPQNLILHAAAALVLIGALLVSLTVFFPGQLLRERIERLAYQRSGEQVKIGGLAAGPRGLRLTNLSWRVSAPDWPAVEVGSLRLSPLWTTLFSENPGLAFKATLSSGVATGRIMKDGSLQAAFSKISLAPFFPADFTYRPRGLATGSISVSGRIPGDDGSSEFDLIVDEAAVLGLEAVGVSSGEISLGQLIVRGQLQGTALQIDELRNHEGDLEAQGQLAILLHEPRRLSRISGRLDLAPAATLDPFVRDLLQLSGVLPDRQGNFHFRLGGSLESPVVR